jgi:hypothetical protein
MSVKLLGIINVDTVVKIYYGSDFINSADAGEKM